MKFFIMDEFPRLLSVTVSEAAVRRCSIKKVFLKTSQNWQENTCVRVSFLIKLHFTLLSLNMRDQISSRFNDVKFQPGLKFFTI